MQFRYPARLQPDLSGEITVSFRDFPECLNSGADESAALVEARDALEEAIAGRIDDDKNIPAPSRRRAGEQLHCRSTRHGGEGRVRPRVPGQRSVLPCPYSTPRRRRESRAPHA